MFIYLIKYVKMEEEAPKQAKTTTINVNKMNIDSEAVAFSVIPFLTPYELTNYLATNKELHEQYDTRTIWNRVMPKWTRISIRDIKKCLHFEQLTKTHTLPDLVDEVTSAYQLGLLRLYCNMKLPNRSVKITFSSLIYLVTPLWLKRKCLWNNTIRHNTLPAYLDPLADAMNRDTMHLLVKTVKTHLKKSLNC